MKLSYIGTRATKDSTDKKRYAEAKWKDGDMNAEDIGYIFRCLLKDYEEFEMIKVLFDEAKDACRR